MQGAPLILYRTNKVQLWNFLLQSSDLSYQIGILGSRLHFFQRKQLVDPFKIHKCRMLW